MKPITVCHRGASALAPENSLAAFEIAMQYGVDFSELDVHLSQDGELVVSHDDVFIRDGVEFNVRSSDAANLPVPRLTDVLDLVRGRMGVYVELKGDGTAVALAHLLRTGAADGVRLIAGSFRLELVADLRTHCPDVPSSILFQYGWSVEQMLGACHHYGVAYAHPCFRPPEGFSAMLGAFHAAGLAMMTPHTNDRGEAEHFARIGVDVIASDDPRILQRLAEPADPFTRS